MLARSSSVSVALPVVGLLLFVSTAPLAVDDVRAAGVNVPSETPVVLVVFDEFALSSLMSVNGSIDAVRYPGFGRLAHDATWYSRATTVYEHTTQAVPAILSGDLPRNGAFPTLNDFPHNLFTLLGGAYSFEVREPVTRLSPRAVLPRSRRHQGTSLSNWWPATRRRHRLPLQRTTGRRTGEHPYP